MRTCIGCRTRKPADDVTRIAIVDGEIVPRELGNGRGASICPDQSCIEAAAKANAFSRAFRTKLADRVLADTLLGWLGKPTH